MLNNFHYRERVIKGLMSEDVEKNKYEARADRRAMREAVKNDQEAKQWMEEHPEVYDL